MKKYQSFLPEKFRILEVKFSIYLNRRVFVMIWTYVKDDISPYNMKNRKMSADRKINGSIRYYIKN